MAQTKRGRMLTLFWLALTGLALLATGAVWQRQAYLTRGIPETLPPPIAYAGVEMGLNVALNQYDDAELANNLAQIAATGVQFIKQPFYFAPDFAWAEADRLVQAAAEHGLTLVPLLDGNPADNFAPPADPNEYAQWAGEFARRYGEQIQYYIIWDEPNLTTHWGNRPVNPAEYAALLTAAAQTIRAVDPDAVIIAAPLAPTIETGPDNLADPLYLQEMYEAGAAAAFDAAAAKPYGFHTGPDDRQVEANTTNFSRAILLREVMERNGDGGKALWAGNWGWNALPENWAGRPSIWGETSAAEQAAYTRAALERARREWPWMGLMFLENWEPDAAADDPIWGFSVKERLDTGILDIEQYPNTAYPGFHFATPDDPAQVYEGGWRFSPEFGADMSPQPEEEIFGDKVTFTFWGTDLGLRVRRASYRARLYVTVDGRPANALPRDEYGAALVLTSPLQEDDYLAIERVAQNLTPGTHTAEIVASRGWDQWALNGFSVAYRPSDRWAVRVTWGLLAAAVLSLIMAMRSWRWADWPGWFRQTRQRYGALDSSSQLLLTFGAAALVAISGWLTWADQAGGVYRRLGDGGQLALTAVAASIFYVSPTFLLMAAALAVLFILIALRPAWGLALITFSIPFYVPPVLKPVFQYRFSPVEIFTLTTFAAFLLHQLVQRASRITPRHTPYAIRHTLHLADYAALAFTLIATLSLFFTSRLDVATNEWRMVILEPALFYLMLRALRPTTAEMWVILDALVLAGVVVALYGLYQYGFDRASLITAEGGLLRLKSIYGSPNNVALFLGRIIPLLAAMLLLGVPANGRRRWLYGAALLPIGLAALLTFSKGAIFLGLPAALLFVFWQWQRRNGRRAWPWVITFAGLGAAGLIAIQQNPALAGRLGLFGETGLFRLKLWQASLNMIREHPLFGVGLDNFLYAYRSRYIFAGAWRDPNLSHPHNIFLDFGTRLGLLGLAAGLWMMGTLIYSLRRSWGRVTAVWFPVAVGIAAAFIDMALHGLVDHSFFLVDLAFLFYLMLGTAVWLETVTGNR